MQLNNSYQPQNIFNDIHKLLMCTKISHYNTKSYAEHIAFDKTYSALNDTVDEISEQLIGYDPQSRPSTLTIGVCNANTPEFIGNEIIKIAKQIENFAKSKNYCDLENLAQELSGIGAQLKYLGTLK